MSLTAPSFNHNDLEVELQYSWYNHSHLAHWWEKVLLFAKQAECHNLWFLESILQKKKSEAPVIKAKGKLSITFLMLPFPVTYTIISHHLDKAEISLSSATLPE